MISRLIRTSACRGRFSPLACLLVLAGALVPASASASIPAGPETRVRGFDFPDAPRVGAEGELSRGLHQAYGVVYGGIASDSLVAPGRGATFGKATTKDYRGTFFEASPELEGKVVVHHAVEQQAAKRFPNAVSESEIPSLENLRGIPKEVNPDVHLSKIRKEWNQFYRQNPKRPRSIESTALSSVRR